MVYAVYRVGVYRHQCGGVFSTLENAVKAADYLAATDGDDHHTYEVFSYYLDAQPVLLVPQKYGPKSPEIAESSAAYITSKNGRKE